MTNCYPINANRSLMAVACFVAAMVLSACGGEGGGEGSRLNSTVPFSDRDRGSDDGTTNSPAGTDGTAGTDDTANAEVPPSSEGDGNSSPVDDTAQSGSGTTEDGGSRDSESDDDAVDPAPSDSDLDTEVSSKTVLRWGVPNKRQNGEELDPQELKGYEIRFRKVSETEFRSHVVEEGLMDRLYVDELDDKLDGAYEYEFEIAAYDVDGLYSEFVKLTPFDES